MRGGKRTRRVWIFALLGAAGLLAVPVVLFGGLILLVLVGRVLSAPPPDGSALVLRKEAVVGTWKDERGGRLVMRADGRFTSHGACGDFSDAGLNRVPAPDSGAGTWRGSTMPDAEEHTQVTEIQLTFVPSGVWSDYEARGTAGHPVLWQYIGDPDDGRLCVLKKFGKSEDSGELRKKDE
jgi:hypothetical protein